MKTFRLIGLAFTAFFCLQSFSGCNHDNEPEPGSNGIPTSFEAGDVIYFDTQCGIESYGYNWFLPKSSTTCQWGGWDYKEGTKLPDKYSSATYTYSLTGENQAILKSKNYQSQTNRTWYVTITMNFETNNRGTYTSEEIFVGGKTLHLYGVFEIK